MPPERACSTQPQEPIRQGSACAASSRSRPDRAAPRTSPTSVCASRAMSYPIFAHAPAWSASADPSSATIARSACHGSTGSASSSSTAKKSATCGPSAPSAERVPAAPPSWAGSFSRSSRSRISARVTVTSHPAVLRPNVVGTACCRSVRAAIGVSRCVSASPAHAAATPSSSSQISPRARRETSIAALSTMSWLVAP